METENLGILFRRAIKKQPVKRINDTTRNKRNRIHNANKYKQSGIKSVSKVRTLNYRQGFFYKFTYIKNGEKHSFQRKTLSELYDVVVENGFDFIIEDYEKANKFIKENSKNNDLYFLLN